MELFVAQIGGEEHTELSIKQGSSLVLSICAQLSSVPAESASRISSLFCVLLYQGVESTSIVEEDLYAEWKLGWHDGQIPSDFSVIEKLVQRAKCEDVEEAVELEHDLVSLPIVKEDTHSFKSVKGSAGRSIAVFTMDRNGKGFSSCNLDVSAFPCGQYQLSFDCVGMDTKNRPWVPLPSRIRETLKITANSATV